MSASKTTIGYGMQLGGIAAFGIGAVLSFHHLPIAASFVGGAASFFIGKKIRALAAGASAVAPPAVPAEKPKSA
ncbi:MAG: hypothetical protein ACRD59_12570 [Candidatus Acidiferrales bacterium]